jgi:hypothetical protein
MHDAIGYDLNAVVMPSDLPGISVGHSNELADRVHELRELDNLVFHSLHHTIIHRPKGSETGARFPFTVPNFPIAQSAQVPNSYPNFDRL